MATTNDTGCRDQRVTLIEVIMDVCANVFNTNPCSAAGEPCYNTFNTCRDHCNYACEPKSYIFTTCEVPPHLAIQYTPNVRSVSNSGTQLSLGKTFSTRGRISIDFDDIPHNDLGFDPYWPRGAIPICPSDKPGTLLGRWIARTEYFQNRRVNVYDGYCDQALCEFTKRSYFIDSIAPSGDAGKVTMVLKDPLILVSDKAAVCPSNDARLVAPRIEGNEFPLEFLLGGALDNNEGEDDQPYSQIGQFLFQDNYLAGDPAQDLFFTRLTHVCVGSEVLRVQPEINSAVPQGWNVRLLERATCGTEISAHKIGDQVSAAETFNKQHIADVICRLLTECSEIQEIALACSGDVEEIIDFESFEAYRCARPLNYTGEVIICKAEGITTLLDQISEEFLLFLYYDPDMGKIRILDFAPPDCDAEIETIDECEMQKNSLSLRRDTDWNNVVSIYYDITDCSKSLSKSNSNSLAIRVDSDTLRSPAERRKFRARNNKEIVSRWFDSCNSFLPKTMAERRLQLDGTPGLTATIGVKYDKGECFNYGQYVRLNHARIQDIHGEPSTDLWYVTGKSVQGSFTSMTLRRTPFDNGIVAGFNCDTSCPTIAVEVPDDCAVVDCNGVF